MENTDSSFRSYPLAYKVAVCSKIQDYPTGLFDPAETYPEYPFMSLSMSNEVYKAVRDLFHLLNLDDENWNTPKWNPLGYLIKPGMTVVIKPNFVLSQHNNGGNLFSIITHPSVIRAITDYCYIAMKGAGRVIVADAPQYDCHWEQLIWATDLKTVQKFYNSKTFTFEIQDLRSYWSRKKHFESMLEPLPGDPLGSLPINIKTNSMIWINEDLYGACYNRKELLRYHHDNTHKYVVSKTIMNADVVISVPKLKVHKKVGVTLNIKGLVGTVTNKNCLAHYTLKSALRMGDQYPDGLLTCTERFLIGLERWMYDHLLCRGFFLEHLHHSIYWLHNHTTKLLGLKVDPLKRLLDAGNWYGNDTAWRMADDLYKIFMFVDRHGQLQEKPQRKVFTIIDGVIGGENNGPLTPTPVKAGVLIASDNLLTADLVATQLMGFDPMRLRMYSNLMTGEYGPHTLEDIQVLSNEPIVCPTFKPHPGWIGHI